MLIPKVISDKTKIVIVASDSHILFISDTIDHFEFQSKIKPIDHSGILSTLKQYAFTKLLNIFHTNYLHILLNPYNITVNCLHPGIIDSSLTRDWNPMLKFFIVDPFMKLFGRTNYQGAQTTVYLATKKDNISGKYYDNLKIAKPSDLSQDLKISKELWEFSEKECRKSCPLFDQWLKLNKSL